MKIIITLGLVVVILIAGCVRQTTYNGGIITHNNSLEEANQKCVQICEKIADEIGGRATPYLNQCTEKECECIC